MGVFNITPRSEVLQPSRMNSPVRHYQGQTHYVSDASTQWRGAERLGKGVTDLATAMMRIGADMAHEKSMIQDNETEAAFVDAMRSKMDAPENGLLQRVAMAGDSDTLTSCVDEGESYFKSAAEDLLTDKGYSGDRKKRMMLRLREAASPFQRTMAQGVLKKTTELKVSSADKDFNSLLETWHSRMTDEDSTRSVIDSFRASQRVRGLADDAVETNTEKIWQSMAYDYVTKNIGMSNRKQLDWLEEHIQDGNGGDLFAFNPVLGEHFAEKDPLGHTVGHRNGGTVSAKDGVKAAILMRRRELDMIDNRAVENVLNVGQQAVSVIRDKDGKYPADRLKNIEASVDAARRMADSLPKGSAAAANAAKGAEQFDRYADNVASEEIFDEYMEALKSDPDAKIYVAETKDGNGNPVAAKNAYEGVPRKERLAQGVQLMVDRQREAGMAEQRAARNASTMAYWRIKMLDGASSPGVYHSQLMNAGLKGQLTTKQVMDLRKEFDEKWVKGFKQGSESPRQILAKTMLGIIQKAFPDDTLETSIAYDQKTGRLGFTKDATYGGFSYERPQGTAKVTRRNPDTGKTETIDRTYEGDNTSALFSWWNKDEKLSAQNVLDIANAALVLADYDGLDFKTDPITGAAFNYVTGESLTCTYDKAGNAVYPKFNAADYFSGYINMIKKQNAIISASDYVREIVGAADELSAIQSLRERESLQKMNAREQERSASKQRVITRKKLPDGTAAAKSK